MSIIEKLHHSIVKRLGKSVNKLGKDQHIIAVPKYKVVYFAIPKVANSSLKKFCADSLDIPTGSKMSSVFNEKFPFVNKQEIVSYEDYFKFAFVRNPWDRLVSCYLSKIRNDENLNSEVFVKGVHKSFIKYGKFRAAMSFDEFVNAVANIPDSIAERHIRSQYCFITDSKDKILVDFVGKFERLNEDWQVVCNQSGIQGYKLPHLLRRENRKPYQEYYSPYLRNIVGKRFHQDIEMFRYEF